MNRKNILIIYCIFLQLPFMLNATGRHEIHHGKQKELASSSSGQKRPHNNVDGGNSHLSPTGNNEGGHKSPKRGKLPEMLHSTGLLSPSSSSSSDSSAVIRQMPETIAHVFTRDEGYDIVETIYALHRYTTYKHFQSVENSMKKVNLAFNLAESGNSLEELIPKTLFKKKVNLAFNLAKFGVKLEENYLKELIPTNLAEVETEWMNEKQEKEFDKICHFKIENAKNELRPKTADALLKNLHYKNANLKNELFLLGSVVDRGCGNIVANEFIDGMMMKGRGDHALCILGHLFAFAVALGKRIEEEESKQENVDEIDRLILLKLQMDWFQNAAREIFQFLGPENGNVILIKGPKEGKEATLEEIKNFDIEAASEVDGEDWDEARADEEVEKIGKNYLTSLFSDKDFI